MNSQSDDMYRTSNFFKVGTTSTDGFGMRLKLFRVSEIPRMILLGPNTLSLFIDDVFVTLALQWEFSPLRIHGDTSENLEKERIKTIVDIVPLVIVSSFLTAHIVIQFCHAEIVMKRVKLTL